jgi:hypothetical protein
VGLGVVAAGGVIAIVVAGGGSGSPNERPEPGSAPEPEVPAKPPPPPAAAPEQPDPDAEVAARVKDVLGRFVAWSQEHRGAPCPEMAALGDAPPDPWGHAFRLTCTDQPGDQLIGAISAGPDGAAGTADDIASWQLGRDVTDSVRGARWIAAAPPSTPPPARSTPARPQRTRKVDARREPAPTVAKPAESKPATTARPKPTKAIELDENGLPVKR